MAPLELSDEHLAPAHRAFRKGRRQHAILGVIPIAVYLGVAAALGADRGALGLGLGALFFALGARYYGRAPGRAMAPAAVVGVIPFIVSHLAQSGGHHCASNLCTSWCLQACACAGVLTGALFAGRANRDDDPLTFFGAGTVAVTLIGAMGCRCLGFGSILGLAAGFTIASAPRWRVWTAAAQ